MNQQQQQRLKHHPLLLLLLLLLLNGGAVVVVEARKKSTTVFLGSGVSAQWEIEGPCTAVTTEFDIEDDEDGDEDELNTNTNNNAFIDPHKICFKSLSQRPQTFTLTFNMGEPGSNIQLPNFPFSANGQTCTTYLYRQAGLYSNVTFSAKLSSSSAASSNMIDFNIPWLIYPNGTCTTGSSAISEADKPTDEVITTFNQIESSASHASSSSSSFHSLLFTAMTVSTTVVITIMMNSM